MTWDVSSSCSIHVQFILFNSCLIILFTQHTFTTGSLDLLYSNTPVAPCGERSPPSITATPYSEALIIRKRMKQNETINQMSRKSNLQLKPQSAISLIFLGWIITFFGKTFYFSENHFEIIIQLFCIFYTRIIMFITVSKQIPKKNWSTWPKNF